MQFPPMVRICHFRWSIGLVYVFLTEHAIHAGKIHSITDVLHKYRFTISNVIYVLQNTCVLIFTLNCYFYWCVIENSSSWMWREWEKEIGRGRHRNRFFVVKFNFVFISFRVYRNEGDRDRVCVCFLPLSIMRLTCCIIYHISLSCPRQSLPGSRHTKATHNTFYSICFVMYVCMFSIK